MGNIAGYVGTKKAAPILIEMLDKQEGLSAGLYTEIVTMHEGKIYSAKVEGDLKHLLATTDAAMLPGTIGMIQSSVSKDNGSDCAKVFLGEGNEEDVSDSIKKSLFDRMQKGFGSIDAMRDGILENPKEVAGLMLSVAEAEAIAFARVNLSMYVGSAEHGMYVATAPLAFPKDAAEQYLLPTWSLGLVKKEGFSCKTFGKHPIKVASLTPRIKAETYEVLCEKLKEGHKEILELIKNVNTLFDEADCTQADAAVYGALSDIYREGNLKRETAYYPAKEGCKIPVYYLTLEK